MWRNSPEQPPLPKRKLEETGLGWIGLTRSEFTRMSSEEREERLRKEKRSGTLDEEHYAALLSLSEDIRLHEEKKK